MKKTTTFIKQAKKINEALIKLQTRARKLADDIYENSNENDYTYNVDGILELMHTLYDLSDFDLEDSIQKDAE